MARNAPPAVSVPASRTGLLSTANRRFARHYVEMVAVMFLGMAVLWLPFIGLLGLAGIDDVSDTAPAVAFLGMATTMTVPMVAWMRRHGHAWRPCAEMAASMFVPTFAAIGLLAAGVGDFHSLMGLEHIAMLLAMLGVMLLRPSEYNGTGYAH